MADPFAPRYMTVNAIAHNGELLFQAITKMDDAVRLEEEFRTMDATATSNKCLLHHQTGIVTIDLTKVGALAISSNNSEALADLFSNLST